MNRRFRWFMAALPQLNNKGIGINYVKRDELDKCFRFFSELVSATDKALVEV
jgi:hypothetical protein